jgi:hypothetical protein
MVTGAIAGRRLGLGDRDGADDRDGEGDDGSLGGVTGLGELAGSLVTPCAAVAVPVPGGAEHWVTPTVTPTRSPMAAAPPPSRSNMPLVPRSHTEPAGSAVSASDGAAARRRPS